MLHLGPARTGTTWLWDLIIDNKLYNKTVKINQSQHWLDFIHNIRSATPQTDQQKQLLDFSAFTLNIITKEDVAMFLMFQQCLLPGGVRGAVLDKEKFIQNEQLYRNRLARQCELGTWENIKQWINHLPIQQSSLVHTAPFMSPVTEGYKWAMPEVTSHISDQRIKEHDHSVYHALRAADPELDHDWEQRDLWEIRLVPAWRRLGALEISPGSQMHAVDDSPRTFVSENGYLGLLRFNVDWANGEASIDDYFTNWLPAEQQQLKDQIECLCSQYDKVKVVIGLRDPRARYLSQMGMQSRVFHTKIIGDARGPKYQSPPDIEQKLEFAEHNDIRITSLMNHHRNNLTNALRDEIRAFYRLCANTASYSQFDKLIDDELPHNCELVAYETERLNDKQYVKGIFGEILPDDLDTLNNFGEKQLASADWPLLPHHQPPINQRMLDRMNISYQRIREHFGL
jgi:hypothetical protein